MNKLNSKPIRNNRDRIAVFLDCEAEYGRGVLRGITKYARPAKTWIVHTSQLSIKSVREISPLNCAGIIAQVINKKMLNTLIDTSIPFIDVAGVLQQYPMHQICMNNTEVGETAANHFIERGFTNFAYLGGPKTEFSILREKGYCKALFDKEHKLCEVFYMNLEQTSYKHKPFGEENVALCQWLKSLSLPSAVFACNDGFALMLSESCQQIGLNVPEDIAILGVDNDEQKCLLEYPPLSSIILPEEEIGYQSAKILDSFLLKNPESPMTIHLSPKGIALRQSSDSLAITDKILAEALRFIRENADKPITVERVCDELMISRRSLEKRTKKLLGHSPLEEIRRAHIARAKTLLVDTDMPMPQVASASGFSSQARLSVVFRRQTGNTPTTYRQQFRNR